MEGERRHTPKLTEGMTDFSVYIGRTNKLTEEAPHICHISAPHTKHEFWPIYRTTYMLTHIASIATYY
jgi:hypothetical protein